MKKSATSQLRNLGKLIKAAEKLGEEIRHLEKQRKEELKVINNNYLPKLRAKREELYKIVKQFYRERVFARFGWEDEELALGKSVTEVGAPLDPSLDLLFAMKETLEDLGVQGKSSNLSKDKPIDDCFYIVPDGCTACTGGGGT